jgi:hypothetical protein
MSLYADSSVVQEVDLAFPTAQHVRRLLQSFGFTPLCRVGDGEHWVRGPRRVVLEYESDVPGKVRAKELHFATLVNIGDGSTDDANNYTLSLD